MTTQYHRPGPGGGGRPAQGQGGQESFETPETILKRTEKVSYFGPDTKILPALLDSQAQAAAQDLKGIPTTQIRRFFGQVSAIKRRLDMDGAGAITDGEVLAQVAFLKASAAYAAGRDKKNNPMLKFIVINANGIASRKDFMAFHRHFETVVAFHKVYAIEKKQD